jgi:ABC-type nitrate/sulfonate/bicarbonate transport system substrate-binding protein
MKKTRTAGSLALLTAALLLSAAACGRDNAGKKEGPGIEKAILILDWVPNTNHTGFYAAKALGYYEAAGLDVDILQPSENTALQLVAVGKGDFGISDQESVTYARTQDEPLPVKSIAAIIQHNTSGFLSLREKNIRTVKDWPGKTYGGWGTPAEENILRYIAEKNGFRFEDFRYVNLGMDDLLSAFRGEVDFAWVFEAYDVVNFRKQGIDYNYIPIIEIDEVFDSYTPVLIAGTKLIEENPAKVRAFVEASAKGYDYAINNPEKAAGLLREAVPELDEYVTVEGQKLLSVKYAEDAPCWGWQEEEVWRRYADLMYKSGQLSRELDAAGAFTNEFLPAR